MRSNHDDRPAAASEEGRAHGAEAVKCSRKICGQYVSPIFLTLSKKEMAPSDSGIANKHRRHSSQAAGGFHHLLHRMRLANIGFVKRPNSTGSHNLRKRVHGRRLVSMVMDPDRPASRRKGQADCTTNPSGCAGHKHRISLVRLVHLVDLVCLVDLVHLVGLVRPNKQDKPNKPDEPNTGGLWVGYRTKASLLAQHCRPPSLAASRMPMVRSPHRSTSGERRACR